MGITTFDVWYPGINTWRALTREEGGGIKHNTTGATLSCWNRGCIMSEPALRDDPVDEEDDEVDSDDDGDDEIEG